MLVFTLASIVSWAAGEVVDWTHDKVEGPQAVAHASSSTDNVSQLLKAAGQGQQQ
jgi:hypothetical protein